MANAPAGEHSQLMDRVYRHQRHIYDLTRKYYLFGRDRTIRALDLRPGQSLVEIGCGTARNLIAIANLYPGTDLYGLDASSEMLRTAAEKVEERESKHRNGVRIALRQAYAETLDLQTFSRGPFDRALFSYSLSMIPDWRAALAAAARVVKPDGMIHIVDFGDLTGLGPLAGGILKRWLKLFHVQPRAEILGLVEPAAPNVGTLWLSPGRYAFSFRCPPKGLVGLGLCHVAEESQSFTKP